LCGSCYGISYYKINNFWAAISVSSTTFELTVFGSSNPKTWRAHHAKPADPIFFYINTCSWKRCHSVTFVVFESVTFLSLWNLWCERGRSVVCRSSSWRVHLNWLLVALNHLLHMSFPVLHLPQRNHVKGTMRGKRRAQRARKLQYPPLTSLSDPTSLACSECFHCHINASYQSVCLIYLETLNSPVRGNRMKPSKCGRSIRRISFVLLRSSDILA